MSTETTTPSAAVLRKLAASVASDLAHAPIRSSNYHKLSALTTRFVALEKTMLDTSDTVRRAIGHAEELMHEARKWDSIAAEGGTLGTVMDESMNRVAGIDASSPASHSQ